MLMICSYTNTTMKDASFVHRLVEITNNCYRLNISAVIFYISSECQRTNVEPVGTYAGLAISVVEFL